MTDRHRVYTKVKKTLKRMMKLNHQGQVVTLAMMISGIVLSRNAQLSMMSSEIPSKQKEKSIEMRMRRWVKGTIDVEAVYMPFARQILEALSHLPLVLVMDGSQAGRGCMVLMVGVLYQKRALPIAWLVYKGKKGHTSAERHKQVLEKVLPLLPEGGEVRKTYFHRVFFSTHSIMAVVSYSASPSNTTSLPSGRSGNTFSRTCLCRSALV